MVERHHVDGVRRQQDDVGLLARRERSGSLVEPVRSRPADRRHVDDILHRQQGRDVRLLGSLARKDLHALQEEVRAHLGEEVGWDLGLDVVAERPGDLVVERLLDRRDPVPHFHLDRRGQRQAAAGVGDQLPFLRGQVAAVDVRDVRPHHPGER